MSAINNGGDEEKMEEPNDVHNGGNEEAKMPMMGNVPFNNTHVPHVPFNVNTYATHKTLTAGCMDMALISSNATQIKMLSAAAELTAFHIATITMLGLSLLMQFIVVFLIITMGSSNTDLTDPEHEQGQRKIDRQNKAVFGMVACITLINVVAAGLLNVPRPPIVPCVKT